MYIIFRHTTSFAENLFKNKVTILGLDGFIIYIIHNVKKSLLYNDINHL